MRSNTVHTFKGAMTIGAVCGALAVTGISARAQVFTTVANSQLQLQVGESGQLNSQNVAGRFGIIEFGTPNGAILRLPRNNSTLLGSYVTVRIDGGTPNGMTAPTQTVPGWDLVFGDVGVAGATDQGTWVVAPTAIAPNKLRAVWSTLPGANATVPIPSIQIELIATVIGSTVSFEFNIKNLDATAHTVGLRFAQDYNVAVGAMGPVRTANLAPISNEISLTGAGVPTTWRVDNNTDVSDVAQLRSAGATLRSLSTSGVPTNADAVVFGNTTNISPSLWAAPITGGALSATDRMAAVFFSPTLYSPGEQKTIRAHFGTGFASDNFQGKLAASVTGPLAFKYNSGTSSYTPSPAVISGSVYNQNSINVTGASATISLPQGLVLATGETATKNIGNIAPNTAGGVSWNVLPATNATGRQSYTVTFTGQPGGQSATVSRIIDIPPAPNISQAQGAGLRQVSFPYVFNDPTPATALGLNSSLFTLLGWNSAQRQYEVPRSLAPGKGYFLSLSSTRTFQYTGGSLIDPTVTQFEIPLPNDWAMIGNPFSYRVLWADVLVLNTDVNDPDYLKPLTVQEAADPRRGWILPSIYWWDDSRGYVWDIDYSTAMDPFQGFWVKALRRNISLLIPAPNGGRAAKASRSNPASYLWRTRIVASSNGRQDTHNFIGVAAGASDTADHLDVQKPPSAGIADVEVGILHNDWASRSGRYAQDIRSQGAGDKTWEIYVTSPKPSQDVTLSWPDITSLPKNVELYIIDPATGARTPLRQTSSLKINTGETGTRSVKITAAQRTAQGALRVISASVQGRATAGIAAIRYGTSRDANTTVRIVGPNGQSIRRLTSRASRAGETGEIAWDYRDQAGRAVPSGAYTIEIVATSDDGQSARVLVPHVVVR